MRFAVVWDEAIQEELARIWMQTADRRAVTDASDHIDQLLRHASERVGAAEGQYRRLVVEPLEVVYAVYPEDCRVRVLQIRYLP